MHIVLAEGCLLLSEHGYTQNGIYTIDPDGQGEFEAYCELSTTDTVSGWTIFQRRLDDSVDFYR